MTRCFRSFLAVLPFAVAMAAPAPAQDYPSRNIRIVVPFAAGGGVDVVARTLAKHLGDRLGQQVYVENRPGASGNLGADQVAKSPADGYSLLVSASTLVVNPVVAAEKAPFDPLRDFTQIALIAKGPLLFIVHPDAATTLPEFVSRTKADPAKFNLATGGFGSAGHMSAEAFKLQAGLKVPVVLYRGTGPAFNDLVGGHISGIMDPLVTSLPLAKSGKTRALALSDTKRSPLAPEVPTFAEAGYPGFEFFTWYGLWGPANLPAPVLAKLSAALKEIGNLPEVKQWFEAQGLEFSGVGGPAFVDFSRAEQARYEEIVKKGNIQRQ